MNGGDKFCVIGAGRIGLPISVVLASRGHSVTILERDIAKCLMINNSEAPFFEYGMEEKLEKGVSGGLLKATNDGNILAECNVVISAIGTGVSDDGVPEVSGIQELVSIVSPHMNSGDLFLLKTTLPIGMTEEIGSMLSESCGLVLDDEIRVAFCPERIVEGKAMEELVSLPKIVGGVGPKSTKRAKEIMSIFGGEVIEVTNSKTAELCKLIDNSYRMTRFGFSADIASVSWRNGIDAYEAIMASNHDYARNDVPLPSVGVSGYCLTKDPYYLDFGGGEIWSERGFPSTWISARRSADFQIYEAIERVESFLSDKVKDPSVVIAGITYKENVDDCRLSHGREIAKILISRGYQVKLWDPKSGEDEVDGLEVNRDYKCIDGADCIIFTVPHSEYIDWSKEMPIINSMRTKYIFDGWGIIRSPPEGVIVHGTGIPD